MKTNLLGRLAVHDGKFDVEIVAVFPTEGGIRIIVRRTGHGTLSEASLHNLAVTDRVIDPEVR